MRERKICLQRSFSLLEVEKKCSTFLIKNFQIKPFRISITFQSQYGCLIVVFSLSMRVDMQEDLGVLGKIIVL